MQGGLLRENKGINLPHAPATLPSLTKKDLADLAVAVRQPVDYIALSFVRNAEDVLALKGWLKRHRREIPVIAKIEKPSAVKQIRPILSEADGIMVARGDLGIEMGAEKIPAVQKGLIEQAHRAEAPVITATEMLETMMEKPRPSRAEVSDVANAVFDGTDAVMLSAETAVGKYPVQAVRTMSGILQEAERHLKEFSAEDPRRRARRTPSPVHAITGAALRANKAPSLTIPFGCWRMWRPVSSR
jgi:pyruvate kinase